MQQEDTALAQAPKAYSPGPYDQAILALLRRAPEPLFVGQVAAEVDISRGAARRALQRLVAGGLVVQTERQMIKAALPAFRAVR